MYFVPAMEVLRKTWFGQPVWEAQISDPHDMKSPPRKEADALYNAKFVETNRLRTSETCKHGMGRTFCSGGCMVSVKQ